MLGQGNVPPLGRLNTHHVRGSGRAGLQPLDPVEYLQQVWLEGWVTICLHFYIDTSSRNYVPGQSAASVLNHDSEQQQQQHRQQRVAWLRI